MVEGSAVSRERQSPDWHSSVAPRQWHVLGLAVLLASGPSLTQDDVDHCHGKAKVLAVNDAYRLAPWADALYACDPAWWDAHRGVPDFSGQKWTSSLQAAEKWNLRRIAGDHRPGLSFDPGLIHYGMNSGYQALNLAIHFGARRIILLGYDMQCGPNGQTHWFGSHPGALEKGAGLYPRFVQNFRTTLPDLERNGITVVNCSRSTALDCFPKIPLVEALTA